MIAIDTNIKIAFKLLEMSKVFIEKEEGLDLKAISKIKADADKIFGED